MISTTLASPHQISLVVILSITLSSCAVLRSPKYQLGDDIYQYKQKGNRYEKAWVYIKDDTIGVLSYPENKPILYKSSQDQFFLKRSFDVDVMTVGFKYRPGTTDLPRQLTTDFNGNVYLGYRVDRFKVSHKKTPFGPKAHYGHRGITAGVFGGIGSTSVTPGTTNNTVVNEYDGLILSRGLAVMIGINTLTVGLGVGWDHLSDRDNDSWIYQNKPWYGLTIGLNLN